MHNPWMQNLLEFADSSCFEILWCWVDLYTQALEAYCKEDVLNSHRVEGSKIFSIYDKNNTHAIIPFSSSPNSLSQFFDIRIFCIAPVCHLPYVITYIHIHHHHHYIREKKVHDDDDNNPTMDVYYIII